MGRLGPRAYDYGVNITIATNLLVGARQFQQLLTLSTLYQMLCWGKGLDRVTFLMLSQLCSINLAL